VTERKYLVRIGRKFYCVIQRAEI